MIKSEIDEGMVKKIGLIISVLLVLIVIIISTLVYLSGMPKKVTDDQPSAISSDPSLIPTKLSAGDSDKQKSATSFTVDTTKLPKVTTGE